MSEQVKQTLSASGLWVLNEFRLMQDMKIAKANCEFGNDGKELKAGSYYMVTAKDAEYLAKCGNDYEALKASHQTVLKHLMTIQFIATKTGSILDQLGMIEKETRAAIAKLEGQ